MAPSLGLLDFGLTGTHGLARTQVAHTVRVARAAEEHGFESYWLAEHHHEGVAWASPLVALGVLAASTDTIRVGSGGVLLGLHEPYTVACEAAVLSALFPDRIELGLARGGAPKEVLATLCQSLERSGPDAYATKVARLLQYLRVEGASAASNADGDVAALPAGCRPSSIWILGSSAASAELAARLGLPIAFSLFHGNGGDWKDGVKVFRERCASRANCPEIALAVSLAICRPGATSEGTIRHNARIAVRRNAVGSAAEVVAYLQELCAEHKPDRLILLDLSAEIGDRIDACVELAAALHIPRAPGMSSRPPRDDLTGIGAPANYRPVTPS